MKFSTVSVLKRYFIEELKFEDVRANDIVSSLFIFYTNVGRFIGPLYSGISYDLFGCYFTFSFLLIVSLSFSIYFYLFTDERFLLINNRKDTESIQQTPNENLLNQPTTIKAEENLLIKHKLRIQRQKKYQTEMTLHTIKYKEDYYFERYFYDYEEGELPKNKQEKNCVSKNKLKKKHSDFD